MIKRIDKYGAEWCNACHIMDKYLKIVLNNYPDIELVKYDSELNEDKFKEMNIKNIPQLFFFDENGVQVHRLSGVHSWTKIQDIIKYHNKEITDYNPYTISDE